MKNRIPAVLLATALMLLAQQSTHAVVPSYINYQGILTEPDGTPITAATDVIFTIYDAATMGDVLWTETRSITPDESGRFTVILGQAVPIGDSVFKIPPCWLGAQVGADPELVPRTLLSSVPFTHRVSTIDGASGGDVWGEISVLTGGTGEGAGVRDPGGNVGLFTPAATSFTDSIGSKSVSYGIDGITMTEDNTVLKDASVDTIFHVSSSDTTISFGPLSAATAQGAIALGDSAVVSGDNSSGLR